MASMRESLPGLQVDSYQTVCYCLIVKFVLIVAGVDELLETYGTDSRGCWTEV